MCPRDDDVSPYLRRPLRTYAEFLRDEAERARQVNESGSPTGEPDTDPDRSETGRAPRRRRQRP